MKILAFVLLTVGIWGLLAFMEIDPEYTEWMFAGTTSFMILKALSK